MDKILFFKDYLTQTFGRPLYRIPIDLPLSCPHRRKNSGNGCIFCSDDGARARHLKSNLDLTQQIESGIEYVTKRYNAKPPYIAYFQSFTNTYADVSTLRKYYNEVLCQADFKMIIIATRPDCLPDTVLDYLEELNQHYEVWVELGVQSANDRTLKLINRAHDFKCVEIAVKKLHKRKIKCAAHVILGLPEESEKDFSATAKKLSNLPFSGIKIHNLLVLKKTPLAKLYSEKKFDVMNEYEYANALKYFLKYIPDTWSIMRMTADAPDEQIIAPKWWMKKGQFIEYMKELMDEKSVENLFPKTETEDGSITLYHPKYKQHFHTLAGAKSETHNKFIKPSNLQERLANGASVRLLDIGFGLGYNALESLKTAEKLQCGKLEIVSVEKDKKTLQAALDIFDKSQFERAVIESLLATKKWCEKSSEISIMLSDARKTIAELNTKFDIVYLDAFSPDKNPELWTYDFIKMVSKILAENGVIITYSSAFPIRSAMLRCKMHTGKTEPFGRRRGGTIAAWNKTLIREPLTQKELAIITKSTAGICYRDSTLKSTTKTILKRRDATLKKLRSKGVPKWHTGQCPAI